MRGPLIALGLVLAGCLSVPEEDVPPIAGPTDGLVAYWSMDTISEDNRVSDAIGGHHGECVSCPTPFASLNDDGALRFDGDAAVVVPASAAFDLPEGTVSAWVYLDEFHDGAIVSQPLDGIQNSWLLGTVPAGTAILEHPTAADYSSATFEVGQWNHVAASWDGSARRIWLNGMPFEFAARPHAYDARPLLIGADVDDGVQMYFFDGAIDDLRIYDRVLSAGEIGQIFEP